jgi:lipoate-protein ligase A
MIRLVVSSSTDPYFNLAAEEYFLRETTFEYVFLYQNRASIIVGKHQNALAEINLPWVLQHAVPVVRRLSGGGTVFHDLGNLNFCFIRKGEDGKLADMKGFAQPVIRFLQSLGLQAFLGEKNDIRLPEGKISGNAEHVYRQRVMHHGTLLFDADLHSLEAAIRPSSRIVDKAVKSNRSNVVNLSTFLANALTISEFTTRLSVFFASEYADIESYTLNLDDEARINELLVSRYQTWEWNYGYSPDFELYFKLNALQQGSVLVSKGCVKSFKIVDDEAKSALLTELYEGVRFFPGEFKALAEKEYSALLESVLFQAY